MGKNKRRLLICIQIILNKSAGIFTFLSSATTFVNKLSVDLIERCKNAIDLYRMELKYKVIAILTNTELNRRPHKVNITTRPSKI